MAGHGTGKKQSPELVEKRISKIRGERHGRWKGGIHRRDYRKMVVKEKCAHCGGTNQLGVHHKDGDHFNNTPENLEVVCNSCHMSEHKKAYWDAIRRGEQPPKSNGPVGWKSEKKGRPVTRREQVAGVLDTLNLDLTEHLPDGAAHQIAEVLNCSASVVYSQIHAIRKTRGIVVAPGARARRMEGRRVATPCQYPDCDREAIAKGYCKRCYQRVNKPRR